MQQIKIAGQKFDLLTPAEARQETKGCNHDWQPFRKDVIVNPARQFVRGHGSHFVAVDIWEGRICSKCGLFEEVSELENAIKSGEFDRILKQRNRTGRRTICELLRELHDEIDDPLQRDRIDMCLLIAKKMNDKLVQYVGYNQIAAWYDDESGEFIEK